MLYGHFECKSRYFIQVVSMFHGWGFNICRDKILTTADDFMFLRRYKPRINLGRVRFVELCPMLYASTHFFQLQ